MPEEQPHKTSHGKRDKWRPIVMACANQLEEKELAIHQVG